MNRRNFTPIPPHNRLIGHRGLAARAPENTMASFKLAASEGIDWVELDIQLTQDHFLVIFHDDTLERTTNGKGLVFEHTLDELSKLDAGSWFDPRFKDEHIPEFATTLPKLIDLNLQLNIELKVPKAPPEGYLYRFALIFSQILRSLWPANRAYPLVSSFNWPLLEAVRTYLPNLPIGYLSNTCSYDLIDKVIPINNASFHCNYHAINADLLDFAHKHGVPILVYTVNDPKEASELLKQGVYALFSDDPTHLL